MTEYASEKALTLFSENAYCQSICLTKKYWWTGFWKKLQKCCDLWEMTSSKCTFLRNYLKCGWSVIFCVEGPIPKSNTKLKDELLCSGFSVIINDKTSSTIVIVHKLQKIKSFLTCNARPRLHWFSSWGLPWLFYRVCVLLNPCGEEPTEKNMNIQPFSRITFSK